MGFFTKIKETIMASTATKIATAAVVVAVVAGGTAGLAYADVFTSPQRAVEKAVAQMEEAGTPAYEEIFGLDALTEALEASGTEVGFSLKLEDISGDELGFTGMTIPNIGVEAVSRVNPDDIQDVSLEFKVADTTLLSGSAYVDKEKVQVSVPQLFSSIWELNYGKEDFLTQLKNSYLMELSGYSQEEMDAIFAPLEGENLGSYNEEMAESALELLAAAEKMQASILYEKGEKQEINHNNETLECKVYTAVVPEEALQEMLDTVSLMFLDFMKGVYAGIDATDTTAYEEFEQEYLAEIDKFKNMTMEYYICNKRIVKQNIFMDMGENKLQAEILYAKEGSPYENMSVLVDVTTPEETMRVTTVVTTEHTEDSYSVRCDITADEEMVSIVFDYEKLDGSFVFRVGHDSAEVSVSGAFGELEKGKKIGLELEKISVKDGEYSEELEVNASLYVKVLEGEITPLEGETMDLLAMNAQDIQAWTEEVSGNVYQMLFSLMGLFE